MYRYNNTLAYSLASMYYVIRYDNSNLVLWCGLLIRCGVSNRLSDISPMPEEYLLISSWLLYLISEIIAISGLVGITGHFGNHNKLTLAGERRINLECLALRSGGVRWFIPQATSRVHNSVIDRIKITVAINVAITIWNEVVINF